MFILCDAIRHPTNSHKTVDKTHITFPKKEQAMPNIKKLLDVFPEKTKIADVCYDFVTKQHETCKQKTVCSIFQKVIEENQNLLKNIPIKEKVRVLFEVYKRNLLKKLASLPAIQTHIKAIKEKFSTIKQRDSEEIITHIFDQSLNEIHYVFPKTVIAQALKIKNTDLLVGFHTLTEPEKQLFDKLSLRNANFFSD